MPTKKSKPRVLKHPSKDDLFLEALKQAVEFHRTNKNDPYNIDTAVMCALIETHDAYAIAVGSNRKI